MSKRNQKYNNTNDIFAAATINSRYASDTHITNPRSQQIEEEEDADDEPVSAQMQHPIPRKIGVYEIRGTVGEGAFSVVKLAYSPETKQYYACKVIERIRLKHNDLEHRFECEIRVHQQMHHHGIVNLIDVLEDEYFYYVFLEFCPGGELFQHIVDSGRLQEEQAKPIIKQILEAVMYIHQMGVSHRDMKPENLLLDQVGHTKISDFGLSRFLDSKGLADTPCGSPCYASPECISGNPYDGRTSDCWSVGVIMYAMVTGQLPWTKRNQTQLFEQIRRGEYVIPNFLSQTCKNFISSLMCVDFKKRLTAAQALQHPFLTGVSVPLSSMLNVSTAIVSLKKVDAFFGLKEIDLEYKLETKPSVPIIDFDKTLREIKGVKVNKISPPSKRRSAKSGRSLTRSPRRESSESASKGDSEKEVKSPIQTNSRPARKPTPSNAGGDLIRSKNARAATRASASKPKSDEPKQVPVPPKTRTSKSRMSSTKTPPKKV